MSRKMHRYSMRRTHSKSRDPSSWQAGQSDGRNATAGPTGTPRTSLVMPKSASVLTPRPEARWLKPASFPTKTSHSARSSRSLCERLADDADALVAAKISLGAKGFAFFVRTEKEAHASTASQPAPARAQRIVHTASALPHFLSRPSNPGGYQAYRVSVPRATSVESNTRDRRSPGCKPERAREPLVLGEAMTAAQRNARVARRCARSGSRHPRTRASKVFRPRLRER